MVGGIKASSPGMKSMSADMFLDLLTMSAPSGEERTPNASAQVERAGWGVGYASAASALHSRRYGACSAEAAASEAFGLSVGGCIRACRDFRPYPVGGRVVASDVCHTPHTATPYTGEGSGLSGKRGIDYRRGVGRLALSFAFRLINMNSDACKAVARQTQSFQLRAGDTDRPADSVGTRGG